MFRLKLMIPVLSLFFGVCLSAQEVAAESESEPQEFGLFGDWSGYKTKAFNNGVGLELVYKGEVNRNLSGGLKVGTVYLDNLDIKATADLEKTFNLNRTKFYLHLLGNSGADRGHSPSLYVGDEQVTSNIETSVDNFKIYSAWFEKNFESYNTSLLFGLHDLNSEFYVTDASGDFLNSSFGVGRELSQTGVNGPSIFPTTSVAFRFKIEPTENFYYQMGMFGAQAGDPDAPRGTHIRFGSDDGFLLVSEFGFYGLPEESDKYAIGVWSYTNKFDHLTDTTLDSLGNPLPTKAGSNGAYLIANKLVNKNISSFIRYGFATTQTNAVKENFSAGVQLEKIIEIRADDTIGLAVTRVTAGEEKNKSELFSGNLIKSDETTFELFYKAELYDGFTVQPDIQYVVNPSFSSSPDFSFVSAIRIELNL